MTADNKVELIGPIDGDALMKWIEECDLVIHFKPELYIKLRDGDFALVPSPSSGDARVLDELEKWTHNQAAESYKAGAMQHGLIFERVNEEIRAKLSELRTTAKEEKK